MAATKSPTRPRPTRSTIPSQPSERRLRLDRNLRLLVVIGLAAFVVAGGAGVWGAKTGTVTASGGGYRMTLQYPAVSRPGLAVRWELRLTHPGGFTGPVRVATTLGYFDLFDFNNLQALPSSITNQGDLAVWEFDPPRGDTLVVDLDASLSPAVQKGQTATTSVLIGGLPAVSVRYETRVMP